ncbi:MAG TPA: TPM domain-containing protein, partial [Luteolibacter sp.]|nr:TPM domain-containing protein [Luteolibacter sp.]
MLFFDQDRKIRIHVGYGLEGALPDARCGQIIRDVIAPRLRAGDREGAVQAGADAVLKAAKGEYAGDGRTRRDETPEEGGWWFVIVVVAFLLLGLRFPVLFRVAEVIFSGGGQVSRTSGGGWYGGGSTGGWSSGRSSGGGFSGGGGRSGGGGASGGW